MPADSAWWGRDAHRPCLGVSVGGARQGPVVRHDGLAERHPHQQLTLVVALVGVELRSGAVASDPEAVREPQGPVAPVGALTATAMP